VTLRRDVSAALVRDGFTRTRAAHQRRLDDDFSLLVDTGPIGKQVDISPFIGLRSDRLEQAMIELRDLPPYDFAATVTANVGYVVDGTYRSWRPPSGADEVYDAIRVALDRLQGYASLGRLPDAWREIPAADANPSTGYRRVVLALLQGDRAALHSALDLAEAEYCAHDDEICAKFRVFQERVGREADKLQPR
jgi:hypothetical protein